MRPTARVLSVLACAGVLLVTAQPVAGFAAPPFTPDPTQGATLQQTPDGPKVFLSAQAATGCGSYCDFKDPQTFRIYTSSTAYRFCATDAVTIYNIGTTASGPKVLQLRYSPWCRTVWARTANATDYYPTVKSYHLNGTWRATAGPVEWGVANYSLMLDDRNLLGSACTTLPSSSGEMCTAKY
jgi:hypothetical protein